jgi:hypothetical protein
MEEKDGRPGMGTLQRDVDVEVAMLADSTIVALAVIFGMVAIILSIGGTRFRARFHELEAESTPEERPKRSSRGISKAR